MNTSDLDELHTAVTAYHVAAARAPLRWNEITRSAGNQQALAAKVVALRAIACTAEEELRMAIASARRSGVTWSHLAALLEFDHGEQLRAWYLEEFVHAYDWPWAAENPPAEWVAIIEPDASN